ncbi:putative protein 35 [Haloarcula hispanica icosahedral virus 2]|uniref:Uncharacterized protein n=1 Tax=Haloarcula hispanica icosahedral virus 2 TaxID=1154689 RepID=H9AZZ1_9VIRU|nr:putative protein 35 [Haloarcula hispanica icosahedral virus 2]AFD02316.1 putative protein 35 [Haloarcula hispanica icosahedral virus 2]
MPRVRCGRGVHRREGHRPPNVPALPVGVPTLQRERQRAVPTGRIRRLFRMTEIDRISPKTRRHITLSREVDGAFERLTPDYVQFSAWVESAMWSALVEQYGEQAVLEAVEATQAGISEEERLPESDREEYELPA